MKRFLIQAVLLSTFLTIMQTSSAADWTLWRGPNRDGITGEKISNPATLNNGAKIVWEKDVGVGHSSCAIKGDMLYTMGNVNDSDTVYCLNSLTGDEVWKYSYSCEAGSYAGPRATPVLDGNNLYTFSRNAQALCLNASSGKIVWQRDLINEENATNPKWGHASSPVIEDSLVIYNAGDHGIALDKTTGKTIWASGKGEASYASAVIFQSKGKKLAAIFSGTSLNAVDIKTGKKVWSHPWSTSYNVHAADPIVSGNYMFLSSGYKTGAGLIDISGSTPSQAWGVQPEMKNHFSSSVLIDGKIYGISGNTGSGKLTCMDFKTGDVIWSEGKGYEGLMVADNTIIIIDKAGVLTLAEVNAKGFVELSKAQVLDAAAKNWTVPVLANGFIYCRNSKGHLACVDVRK